MTRPGDFRYWVSAIWRDYCEERINHGEHPILTMQEYFNTYKYWLKYKFRCQQGFEYQIKHARQQSEIAVDIAMDDKLGSTGVTLLTDQYKLIKTLKEENEK